MTTVKVVGYSSEVARDENNLEAQIVVSTVTNPRDLFKVWGPRTHMFLAYFDESGQPIGTWDEAMIHLGANCLVDYGGTIDNWFFDGEEIG